MWIARRSKAKWNHPGKLDNFVAGAVPFGHRLTRNLQKECSEEASLPTHLMETLIPTGCISYYSEFDLGLHVDCLLIYDLELPKQFEPICADGEVDEYFLWPIDRIARTVRDTRKFKSNCNLVIIDFLIRHGFITPENLQYEQLNSMLHPKLPA